jgi:putative SOS response-associated peptidase YedK
MLVAIRPVDGQRGAEMTKWGLILREAKDPRIQYSTHNARREEFRTKSAFRDAWKRGQRCLVVTNGFYEWKKLDPRGKKNKPTQLEWPMIARWSWLAYGRRRDRR